VKFRIDLSSYTSALTGFLSFPSDTITPLSYPIAAVNYHTIPLARCLALALIVQLRARRGAVGAAGGVQWQWGDPHCTGTAQSVSSIWENECQDRQLSTE